MSITIGYFFNHPHDLLALAEEINAKLGYSFSPYQGNSEDQFCRFLGMELSLFKHTLENDREVNFEDFTYQVDTRTPWASADLRAMQLPAMALLAFALYRRMGITGMLVYDAQVLLARYEERLDSESGEMGMFDTVSDQFVRFPIHFDALHSRLPKGTL